MYTYFTSSYIKHFERSWSFFNSISHKKNCRKGSSHEVYKKTEASDIKAGSTRKVNQDIRQTVAHLAEEEILYIFAIIKICTL